MGCLQPAKEKPVSIPVKVVKNCDKCGYSKSDNSAIARAEYQVDVLNGTLYFCAHHFQRHSGHIFSQGYKVKKLGA